MAESLNLTTRRSGGGKLQRTHNGRHSTPARPARIDPVATAALRADWESPHGYDPPMTPTSHPLMAELITAVEGGLDHDNDPLVVQGRYTGMPIEIGFFSRNREVAATSMSVHG